MLSKTTNEFNDSLFKFHYPADWIYSGLSAGYISSDLKFTLHSLPNNYFTVLLDVFNALAAGDEIVVPALNTRYWITELISPNKIKLESAILGNTVSLSITDTCSVLRPGRRNQLMQEAGSVVSLVNPIVGSHISFPELNSAAKIINASMKEFNDGRVKYCDCDIKQGAPAIPYTLSTNPYVTGEKGNWYPATTWSFLKDRTRNTVTAPYTTNIRNDGAFISYSNFWICQGPIPTWQRYPYGWQWVETVTKKDVNGLTLETSDILGRHNSLMTGYEQKLVVAEAGNASINEILFEGFEDWNYQAIAVLDHINSSQCMPSILKKSRVFQQDTVESHSGKFSGKLVGSGKAIIIPVSPPINQDNPKPDCIGTFMPTTNKKYVISAWVRDDTDPLAVTFDLPSIRVGSAEYKTSGDIIDGWQRIYGEFFVPTGTPSITLMFLGGSGNIWFDDIRIFPFEAKMITHVYDGNTQKLTYTSDENNYFTKYNYDASDNLESISKETEKGVQTIQEARSSTVKLP